MAHFLRLCRRVFHLLRRKAAFGRLAADVHLQQNILHDAQLIRLLVHLGQQLRRADGLDQGHLAHHLLHLVALQVADEMQRRAAIGVLRQLGGHLLHPVLAQGVDAGGDGLLAGGGIVHLAGAHQRDIRPGAARLPCRRVDLGADRFQIFPNRHRLCLLVSFVSKPRAPAGGGCRRVYRMTLPSYSSPDVAMT